MYGIAFVCLLFLHQVLCYKYKVQQPSSLSYHPNINNNNSLRNVRKGRRRMEGTRIPRVSCTPFLLFSWNWNYNISIAILFHSKNWERKKKKEAIKNLEGVPLETHLSPLCVRAATEGRPPSTLKTFHPSSLSGSGFEKINKMRRTKRSGEWDQLYSSVKRLKKREKELLSERDCIYIVSKNRRRGQQQKKEKEVSTSFATACFYFEKNKIKSHAAAPK